MTRKRIVNACARDGGVAVGNIRNEVPDEVKVTAAVGIIINLNVIHCVTVLAFGRGVDL